MNGPDSKRSFINKPRYIQAAVLLAGVTMNFLVAWLLLSVGFMSGLPTAVGTEPSGTQIQNQALTVTSVLSGSPAEKGGLKIGDKLVSLSVGADMTETPSPESVKYFVKRHASDAINVSYVRGHENMTTKITPEALLIEGAPGVGISMDLIGVLKLPIHKALWQGLKLSWDLVAGTFSGFYTMIRDAVTGHGNMSAITGPVGIVGVVGDAAKFGFIYLLSFTALISINLAVINLMPFPALDGGRLLFLLIEKIKGSRINPKVGNTINIIGFGLLMILMVIVTYHDILKLL
jgi:regulator of sigma E protease